MNVADIWRGFRRWLHLYYPGTDTPGAKTNYWLRDDHSFPFCTLQFRRSNGNFLTEIAVRDRDKAASVLKTSEIDRISLIQLSRPRG